MRRVIAVLFLACLFAAVAGLAANAGPAPNLSQIRITHVGSEISGWKTVAEARKQTIYGQNFYLAAHFIGYPDQKSIKISSNGFLVKADELTIINITPVDNPASGYIYEFKMPLKYSKGLIVVQANGINGGQKSNSISGIIAEYRSN